MKFRQESERNVPMSWIFKFQKAHRQCKEFIKKTM